MNITLTNYERAFLQQILGDEQRRAEEWLKEHEHDFSAYFVRNETLPFLASMIKKLDN